MKLVAANPFANVKNLGIKLEDYTDSFGKAVLAAHKADGNGNALTNHIHKGARFSIGAGEEFARLSQDDKDKILMLVRCGRICYAKDTDTVKRIDEEVKKEDAAASKIKPAVPLEQLVAESTAKAIAAALPGIIQGVAAAIKDPKAALASVAAPAPAA